MTFPIASQVAVRLYLKWGPSKVFQEHHFKSFAVEISLLSKKYLDFVSRVVDFGHIQKNVWWVLFPEVESRYVLSVTYQSMWDFSSAFKPTLVVRASYGCPADWRSLDICCASDVPRVIAFLSGTKWLRKKRMGSSFHWWAKDTT